jgi:TPR repeat protein
MLALGLGLAPVPTVAQPDSIRQLLQQAADDSLREKQLRIVVVGGADLGALGGKSAEETAAALEQWLESLRLEAKFLVAHTDFESSAIVIFHYGLATGPAPIDLASQWLELQAEKVEAMRKLIADDPKNKALLEERELLRRELAIAEGKEKDASELVAALSRRVTTVPERETGSVQRRGAKPQGVELPDEPRVALIVRGDPVFADALGRELDARLRDAGFDIVDRGAGLQPADAALSLAEVVPRLAGRGDLLVAVEIEDLGQRQLRYLGREEWLFSARLDALAFLLPTGSALAGGWSDEVEYTETTAALKAAASFEDLMPELAETLRSSWDDYRESLAEAAAAEAARAAAAEAARQERLKQPVPPPAVADPLAAYESGDYARAVELWTGACGGGETIACYNAGLVYLDGADGVARDGRRAAGLFRQACDGGEAAGCFNLGAMYGTGDGIPRDPGKSAALFRQACDGGAETACFNLGLLYFGGDGVLPRDVGKAGELFRRACDGGYAAGCFNLGTLYASGDGGLPRDDRQAAKLFQRACDGGEDLGCASVDELCDSHPPACEGLDSP